MCVHGCVHVCVWCVCVVCVVCGVRVLRVCVCVYHNVYVPRDLLNLRNLKIRKLRTDFETVLRFIKNCHPISKLHCPHPSAQPTLDHTPHPGKGNILGDVVPLCPGEALQVLVHVDMCSNHQNFSATLTISLLPSTSRGSPWEKRPPLNPRLNVNPGT